MDGSWRRILRKLLSIGEGNIKPYQHSWLENPINSMKRQRYKALKDEPPPGQQVSNMLLVKGRKIAPEGMKRLSQSRNIAQLWMYLVVKVKFSSIKNSIA